jgi:YD repeat-containing protein
VGNPASCAIPKQSGGNVGSVVGYYYQDNTNPLTHTTSYALDAMLRLTSSVATGAVSHNLTFTYDRYGNMSCQTNSSTNGPCPNWIPQSGTSTNQITSPGFSYV